LVGSLIEPGTKVACLLADVRVTIKASQQQYFEKFTGDFIAPGWTVGMQIKPK
jgi:hypothetical protein